MPKNTRKPISRYISLSGLSGTLHNPFLHHSSRHCWHGPTHYSMSHSGKAFERILIVMFENQYRSYVSQNAFMQKLAQAGADMTNYFGAFHPSQTNYIASLAGEVCAVTNDTPPAAPLMQQTLVDLLEAKNVSWKAYMEALPAEKWNPAWQNPDYPASEAPTTQFPTTDGQLARYFRKHNAFASFHTIQRSEERWQKIVDEKVFWQDVYAPNGSTLPQYCWFTPDIWNDGHYLYNTHTDTNPRTMLVPQMAGWLEYVLFGKIDASNVQGASASGLQTIGLQLDIDLLLTNPKQAWANSKVPPGTLIVVTFDEADYDAHGYDTNYDGPNQVYTVLLGDMIEPGTSFSTPYNHYSLIRTIEKNFDLGTLGKNDHGANHLRNLWHEEFAWNAPAPVGQSNATEAALAWYNNTWWLATTDAANSINISSMQIGSWTPAKPTGFKANGPIALAGTNAALHLVFANTNNLQHASFTTDGGWNTAQSLGQATQGDIALAAYTDYADRKQKLMLCWAEAQGFINSMHFADNSWQAPQPTGQLTDGKITLSQFGPSLFLVYQQRNTRKMRITSYNTGPFNAFEAKAFNEAPTPNNNTSLHQWSPADWPVGHFALKMAALQDQYQTIGPLCMAAIDGELHLVHRQGYADTPNANTCVFGLTGIFTASSPLTNGYGTLDQAGWTLEQELTTISIAPNAPLAIASSGTTLLLAWQDQGGNMHYCTGHYTASRKAEAQPQATLTV